MTPLVCAARAFRTSVVCGNEPIVVVGNDGRLNRRRCALDRTAKLLSRLAIFGLTAARRAATPALWTLGDTFRAETAAGEAASASFTSSRPPASALPSVASSPI